MNENASPGPRLRDVASAWPNDLHPNLNVAIARALAMLEEALALAQDVNASPWEFAVDIGELTLRTGASHALLRWMLARGLALHAHEAKPVGAAGRTFVAAKSGELWPNTAFILSAAGLCYWNHLSSQVPSAAERIEDNFCTILTAAHERGTSEPISTPCYRDDRRELLVGSYVVRRFRRPAGNQQRILIAFEQCGWQRRIDNPLDDDGEALPQRRLGEAIRRLNRGMKMRLVRFSADGTGLGVLWELCG